MTDLKEQARRLIDGSILYAHHAPAIAQAYLDQCERLDAKAEHVRQQIINALQDSVGEADDVSEETKWFVYAFCEDLGWVTGETIDDWMKIVELEPFNGKV